MVENDVLIHELQLGESLNQCVQQARRADFALMLAMLTDDVRESSQFLVPQTEVEEKVENTETLRKIFDLPKPQPLSLSSIESVSQYNQANLVAEGQVDALRLTNVLNPKPLSFRDDTKHVPTEVMANTSIHCQRRALDKAKPERLSLNAKEWLKSLQNSLTQQVVEQSQLQVA